MGTSQDRNWKIIEISMMHVRTLLQYTFLWVLINDFTVLVPSTSAVTKNNRPNCTSMQRRNIQSFIVVGVARSPITPIHWLFSELFIRAGVARNLKL